ncbi:hypothetical protein FSB64_39885 [Paraburkholderia sp. JPY454]|uniref:Transposase n=1 Tax=Paraburkholderia youngii TaxID=2782701 RepID=A0ABX2NYQ0_9BURK|nr:hypothetical protein [Paraburkholderia youngii]
MRQIGRDVYLRLKETVKKWLPQYDVVRPEIIEVQSGAKKWCAFNDDAALKASSVAKLQNEMTQNQREQANTNPCW